MISRIPLLLLCASIVTANLQAAESDSSPYIQRKYEINQAIVSYQPGGGITTVNNHGGGMVTGNSTLSNQVSIDGVIANVRVYAREEKERFLVTVDVEPESAKRSLGFERQALDMSELKPTAIRLATNKTGRVYQINLMPTVQITDNTPRQLDINKLQLQNWRFLDSPVLVNDAVYVGRIGCAHSPVAFLDISGIARVEFSLYELPKAKPWGVLNRGVVTLTNPDDHTAIQISNVSNGGPDGGVLPGVPYLVWVRWSKPTYTVEQYRQELVKQRQKILDGKIPNADTDYLDKQLARQSSPWISSSGIHALWAGRESSQ